MVRFYGLCDGSKIMVRKTKLFWFLCGNVYFFAKILARVILITG